MGNGYNHHLHLHLHHQSMHFNHKGTFFPILCSKPSIKDVSLPKWQDKSGSCLSDDDPLSPKISCMGQVKRKDRIVGFPAASHDLNLTTKNGCNNGTKYSKLKKLFSGKNITASPAATTTATATTYTTTSCRRKEVLANRTSGRHKHGEGKENSASINIENMDPPLPVIKRVPKQGDKGDGDTLWQRRSRGVALNSLQIQQVQLNRHQEPTTV